MPCCAKRLKQLFFGLFFAVLAASAAAGGISVREAQLRPSEEGYSLSADFEVSFNTRLEEAVNRGVVLYFTVDFELNRPRWYWFDEPVVQQSRTYQLSFHALTRQYRLASGALHQSFASLDEALHVLSRLRGWPVVDKGEVRADQTYLAALRMRLDLSQMPKTFQVSALSNKDWALASDWARWSVAPAEIKPAPAEPGPSAAGESK